MSKSDLKNRHAGHRERMRERLKTSGFDNYRPHEVIEQLLFGCLPRVNTNPIGHDLIDAFGSVMGVLRASPDELCRVEGIGRSSAEYIASIIPTISEAIAGQYRTMGAVSHEMATFLFDWFMNGTDDLVGIIVCDEDGVFREYRGLKDLLPFGSESDAALLAEEIVSLVGDGKYIIAFAAECGVERSSVYRLLDRTAKDGAIMMNAYVRAGVELKSLLFL